VHCTGALPSLLTSCQLGLCCTQDVDGSGRGPEKLQTLKDNSNYFRAALLRMGCTVLGDWDSPVMVCSLHNSLHASESLQLSTAAYPVLYCRLQERPAMLLAASAMVIA